MIDSDLLTLIRNTPALKALADQGSDATLAAQIPSLATVTVPKPFTVSDVLNALSAQAQTYLLGLAPADQDAFASRIRAQDVTGLEVWASLLEKSGKFAAGDGAKVAAVVSATQAVPDASVDHVQVSRVLSTIRPRGSKNNAGVITADPNGPILCGPISW